MRTRITVLFITTLTLLAACNGGSSYSPTAPPTGTNPPAANNTISILGDRGASSFSPNPASAKAGAAIQWMNSDNTTHHIVSNSGNVFDTGNLGSGATSKSVTINQTGSYPYHCTIHPGMVGTLNVTQ